MRKPTTKELLTAFSPLIALVAGYFSFEPIQEATSPPATIEIQVPESKLHNHPQKDWLPVIKEELEKARAEHTRVHH